jgi:transposase
MRRRLRRRADEAPYACFIKAFPAETTEAFLDGHVSAFAFFGGGPISILYDNLKI